MISRDSAPDLTFDRPPSRRECAHEPSEWDQIAPSCVQELAEIQSLVVQVKAIQKGDFLPLSGLVGVHWRNHAWIALPGKPRVV